MRDTKPSGKRSVEEVESVRPREGKLERLKPESTKHKKAKGAKAGVGTDKEETLRKTGIDILGEVGWGTHFCLFYHTRQDLIDILVPYFKAGLENNEFCMWVTSEPLKADDAKRSLKRAVKNLDKYIKKGQIEILDYSDWYTKTGEFEADRVLQGWVEKHDQAIKNGFDGLRTSGNTFWLAKKDWRKFTDYEAAVNSVIGKCRMLAICTYSLERCRASEILDVEHNHQFSLIKWKGDWKVIESSDRNQFEARLAEQTMISEALEHSKKEWVETFNAMSDWVCMVDLKGRILRTNRIGEEFTGVPLDEIIDQSCCRLVHGSDKHIPGCPLLKMLETGQRASAELQVPDTDQWVTVTVDPVTDEEGKIIAAVHITRDITERKRAEEALWESEANYRSLFENALDMIHEVDEEGRIVDVNKIELETLGYSREEFLGKLLLEVIHPDYRKVTKKVLERTLEGEYVRAYETAFVSKKGERILVEVNVVPKIEGEKVVGARAMIRDITKRKKAEKKLLEDKKQLRSLASELSLTEERERRRIATELHDTIGQSLVISKIKLDALRTSAPSGDLATTLEEVCNSLDQTIQEAGSLTFDLSSPILYELGFEPAVAAWLTEEIEEKHGIATKLEEDKQPKPLDDDVRVLLFRTVRELLVNVVKHARAKKIKVSICRVGGEIHVSVEDDGVGFDPAEIRATAVRKGGFGLFSIRERLEQLGGHLELESAPGRGTKATLIAPLKREKINKGEKR